MLRKRLLILLMAISLLSFGLLSGCEDVPKGFEEIDEEIEEDVADELVKEYVEGEFIVSFGGPTGLSAADLSSQEIGNLLSSQVSAMEEKGFEVVDSLLENNNEQEIESFSVELRSSIIDKMGFVHKVRYGEEYESLEVAKEALTDSNQSEMEIKYIEPNYKLNKLDTVESNMAQQQRWHYGMINAPQAWQITQGSRNVDVAVVDTGIDHTHPNLAQFVDPSRGAGFAGHPDTMDRHFHGTHVAGTIASYGQVSGVMRQATLIPIKVIGAKGTGDYYALQQGILHAANLRPDVVNMSVGGPADSHGIRQACQIAYNHNVPLIAAAGNEGRPNLLYPAAYETVISVGAVDQHRRKTNFSNYGAQLDVVAPGIDIFSTVPGNGYRSLPGTSMASPHVAGQAGLMKALNPNLSVNELRNIIFQTAQNLGNRSLFGHGLVDVNAAVAQLSGGNQQPSTNRYIIRGYYSGNVVGQGPNSYLQHSAWSTSQQQTWELESVGSNQYKIINSNSGKVMDLLSQRQGDYIVERGYAGHARQHWKLIDLNWNGYYAIQNVATGQMLLEHPHNQYLHQWPWARGANQYWKVSGLDAAALDQITSISELEDVSESKDVLGKEAIEEIDNTEMIDELLIP